MDLVKFVEDTAFKKFEDSINFTWSILEYFDSYIIYKS